MDPKLLLIEAETTEIHDLHIALSGQNGRFVVTRAATLLEALQKAREAQFEIVLLNLCLPDSCGIDTFEQIANVCPEASIFVMGNSRGDGAAAKETMRRGARDYILKDALDGLSLARATRNMIASNPPAESPFLERERAEVTLNCIGEAVISTDSAGIVTYMNKAAERMTGWLRSDASGRPVAEVLQIVDSATRQPRRYALPGAITDADNRDTVLIHRDGSEIPIEVSAASILDKCRRGAGTVILLRDVSVARAMARRVAHLAQHDPLTDLPNRMLFIDRLTQAISLARRNEHQLAVLFMDLDGFKQINDLLGHSAGDSLLQSIAGRLTDCVRNSDTVSRLGGDEFVILLSDIARAEDAAITAKKILSAMSQPCTIGEHDLALSVSIGVSTYPADGLDAETLVKHSDIAMYEAKKYGRRNYQFFQKHMNTRDAKRQSFENDLRLALERHELRLHYQPKINLATRAITGVEAFVRWQRPDQRILLASEFLSIAEECGLTIPIGRWVLREACRQAQSWLDAGLPTTPICVNVSSTEFRDHLFIEGIQAILRETRIDPNHVELEFTEKALMQRVDATAILLQTLKYMGLRLAVDDFGTGYSSLSYLTRLPINTLKMDMSLVQAIGPGMGQAMAASAVIGIGKSLKYNVVAEGVENSDQLNFLSAHTCDEAQGYYFAPPMIADELVVFLQAQLQQVVHQ